MLIFKSRLRITFKVKRFSKKLDRTLGICFRKALRAWLRAILVSVAGSFPVWSGQAKSTLKPLGRTLKVAVPVRPLKRRPNGRPIPDRRIEGEKSSYFSIRDDKSHPGTFIYTFYWRTKTLHYLFNEIEQTFIKNTPWHTLVAGQEAFRTALLECIKDRLGFDEGDIRITT